MNELVSLKRKLSYITDVSYDDETSDDDVAIKIPDRKKIAAFSGLISILSLEGAEFSGTAGIRSYPCNSSSVLYVISYIEVEPP